MYVDSYVNILNKIAKMGVVADSFINISNAEEMNCVEFDFYLNAFTEKYEKESESRKELITAAFKTAKNCTEIICKTIGGVFGGKKKST
jgi:hypothetical protein